MAHKTLDGAVNTTLPDTPDIDGLGLDLSVPKIVVSGASEDNAYGDVDSDSTTTQNGHDDAENTDDDNEDDAGSVHSQTSTVEYEHEPFESFQCKVLTLAQQTIWPQADPSRISVERMVGGVFNHIIDLSLTDESGAVSSELVLRISRWDDTQVDRTIASLRFARHYTTVPVPKALLVDESADNVVKGIFMLHAGLKGCSIDNELWSELAHAQECKVAKELGSFCRQILAIRSSRGGYLT